MSCTVYDEIDEHDDNEYEQVSRWNEYGTEMMMVMIDIIHGVI